MIHAPVRPDRDVRLGGTRPVNVRGYREAMALPRAPRPFLRPDPHRDPRADHDFVARHAADFHERRVHDFSPRELSVWRGGRWHNEWHYGRRGWWWEVDGVWYGYPEPIWPYPLEVADLTVYDTPVVDGPDLTALEGPPDPDAVSADDPNAAQAQPAPEQTADAAPSIPPLPPAPPGWYRCDSPNGYFPGVQACPISWNLVQTAPLPGEQ